MQQIPETGVKGGKKTDILSAADPPVGIQKNLTPSVSMLTGIGGE